MIKKKKVIYWPTLTDFHNKLQQISFKNSFVSKSYFGEKGHASLI
jgi:hypothetical protein